MRRYDEPVEVRSGPVPGWPEEGPAQFLWRGRLWKVRAVVAHWVETGPWWQHSGLRAVIGTEDHVSTGAGAEASSRPGTVIEELLDERERWRVEAGPGGGTFDLVHQRADGCWQLVGCAD